MAQAKAPVELLRRDFGKLQKWLTVADAETPTVAVGALGELIASKALRLPIVSVSAKKFDLSDGARTVEVKTRTKNNRIDLKPKDCGEVALVRVSRGKNNAGEPAIKVDSIRRRCADKKSSDRKWHTVQRDATWLPATEDALIAALTW